MHVVTGRLQVGYGWLNVGYRWVTSRLQVGYRWLEVGYK